MNAARECFVLKQASVCSVRELKEATVHAVHYTKHEGSGKDCSTVSYAYTSILYYTSPYVVRHELATVIFGEIHIIL